MKSRIWLYVVAMAMLLSFGIADSLSSARANNKLGAPIVGNLIPNGDLELEATGADGSVVPAQWVADGVKGRGSDQRQYSYSGVEGTCGSRAATVAMSTYNRRAEAEWFPLPVPVTAGTEYTFRHKYISDVDTQLFVQWTNKKGKTWLDPVILTLGPVDEWTTVHHTIVAPAKAVKVTFLRILKSAGTLTVDDYYLTESKFDVGRVTFTFDDAWANQMENAVPQLHLYGLTASFCVPTGLLGEWGRMNHGDLQYLQECGFGISSHSRTHPDLTSLDQPDPLAVDFQEARCEIRGSFDDLDECGIPTRSFVYPYGLTNAAVDCLVREVYCSGARGTKSGFNDRGTDRYDLRVLAIDYSTSSDPETIVAEVKAAMDQAAIDRVWLIVLFHQVENEFDPDIALYAISTSNFAQICEYADELRDNGLIDVVTLDEGLDIMPQ